MNNRDSATRAKILKVAHREICRSGFRGANINRVVSRSGMTKGALYYYFKGKSDLNRAVVDEVLAPEMDSQWIAPLKSCHDPIDCLQSILAKNIADMTPAAIRKGVPLVDGFSELTALELNLRRTFDGLRRRWVNTVAGALRKGQTQGTVVKNIDARQAAVEMQAFLMGVVTLARVPDGLKIFKMCLNRLIDRLDQLRSA